MTKQEIDEMCAKRSELTEEQKTMLSKAIMENEETCEIALRGAIGMNHYPLAFYLLQRPKQPE